MLGRGGERGCWRRRRAVFLLAEAMCGGCGYTYPHRISYTQRESIGTLVVYFLAIQKLYRQTIHSGTYSPNFTE